MVLLKPLNKIENKIAIEKKAVEVRIHSEENFQKMGNKINETDWSFLPQHLPVGEKMKMFQDFLLDAYNLSFGPSLNWTKQSSLLLLLLYPKRFAWLCDIFLMRFMK